MKTIILAFLLSLSPLQSIASDNDWLLGNWVMTYDPDGDTEDKLAFQKGGKFITTEASSGKQIKGLYTLKKDHVNIDLVYQGEIFTTLTLTFDKAKDKLYYYSEETRNTAYYTKIK